MKIIVCVKQVPDTSGKVAVNPDGTLNRASMQTITNPDDMNAVEAALKLKDATGCKVVVVTMGPPPAAGMLRAAGLPCPVVSVGSTPTAHFACSLEGVSEVRAGTHVFHDLVMWRLGVCEPEDIALSVLATVIGRRTDGGLLLDAGWTALSRDQGGPGGFDVHGYGLVCNLDGQPYPGLCIRDTNQEHALAHGPYTPPLPVGSRVRILPVHACATAACFDAYHLLREGRIVAELSRCRGW